MGKMIFAAAMAVIAFASCNKEGEQNLAPAEGTNIEIRFTASQADTRTFFDAAAETWEKQLNEVAILVFDAAHGRLVLRRDMTPAEITGGKVRFSLPWSAANRPLHLYGVANYAVTDPAITESGLKALLDDGIDSYNGTFAEVTAGAKRAGGFTMSGYAEVAALNANSTTVVGMTLRRTVAKVAMRVTVDDEFTNRYPGAGIRINRVIVSKSEPVTPVIAPSAPVSGIPDRVTEQASNPNGRSYDNLFYLFENASRAADDCVTLTVEALFDPDGDFSTAGDQSITTYEVKLNRLAGGAVVRNGYYRVDAFLKGLEGSEIEITIKVADWENPITQSESLGN